MSLAYGQTEKLSFTSNLAWSRPFWPKPSFVLLEGTDEGIRASVVITDARPMEVEAPIGNVRTFAVVSTLSRPMEWGLIRHSV